MEAVIIADRLGSELAPLDELDCPALFPIAGKAVVEHCLEDLWEAGIREATIAYPESHPGLPGHVGNGARFGMKLKYLPTHGEAWPAEVLARARPAAGPVLVARGDVLRGRSARLLRDAAERTASCSIHAMHGRRHAGIALCDASDRTVSALDWSVMSDADLPTATHGLGVDHAGFNLLDSPAGWHRAALLALAGRFRGLLPAGRTSEEPGLLTGPGASMSRSASIEGIARIGRHARVRDNVVLRGCVDVGDECVIDEGAEIADSIVLPGTYVGRRTRLNNAIAAGRWLFRADLGTCEFLDDPLLLDHLPGRPKKRIHAAA